jgi:two-component system nitrogen regulation response regulator GlnG
MSQARPPRILVVDDEERVRGVLCDLLAAWGCQADGAASSAQGLDLFARGDYDVVLTDFLMPGGNGLELIEGVRLADPAIGVIMLTASDADLAAPSERLEFTVLRKPLQLDSLKAAVNQALRRRARGTPVALH